MNILEIAILAFILMEGANIAILYFWPQSRKGNGVAVFNFWHKSQEEPQSEQALFVQYMTNWVPGCKLIFVFLLLVILFMGDEVLQVHAVVATILSIASYYWRLGPIIRRLDQMGAITPKGYSKVLDLLITSFMGMFLFALILYKVL